MVNYNKILKNGIILVQVESDELVLRDVSSALDLMMSVRYETGGERILLSKSAVSDSFFRLSSGLAGEVLQKFINYQMKLAIYGDFSGYNSKPLKDFIYESNQGKDFCFLESLEAAVEWLGK